MHSFNQSEQVSGLRVLFVRPGVADVKQVFAMDHYAQSALRAGMYVGLLGDFSLAEYSDRLTTFGGFPSFSVNSINSLFRRLSVFSDVIKEYRPDIVHVRNHFGDWFLPMILKKRMPNAKIILDIRTMATSARKHKLIKILRSVNGRGYNHVFALNQEILDEYIPESVSTSLLPLGYDDSIFNVSGNNLRYVPGSRLRCIYFGSMNRVRCLDRLIHGLILSLNSGLDIEANLFGEGNDVKRLASLVPESYSDRINFHPFLDQNALVLELRNHHLGLAYIPENPILDPNLPLKTVEMLACGLPVLATQTRGNRKVVTDGENGFIVNDSPEGIMRGVKRAIQGKQLTGVSPEVRADSVREYRWRDLAEQYLFPVYERLING